MLSLGIVSTRVECLNAVGSSGSRDVSESEDAFEFKETSDAEVVNTSEDESRVAKREESMDMEC